MQIRKTFARALFFFFLLACLLTGLVGVVRVPVNAAPQMQATSCIGSTITQWTFTGDVKTPSIGSGVFTAGPSLPSETYAGGASGGADRAISYSNWTLLFNLSAYIELYVPTTGRNSINISFDYRATPTGPSNLDTYYSTDGTNFSVFGSTTVLNNNSAFHSLTIDLSSLPSLNDNANAKLRLFFYGASGTTGTLRLDNVSIAGNCLFPADTATPSPSPTPVPSLSVLINEVAWGGTLADTGDEWFELYNSTGADINLSGWRLVAGDGSPDILLSGTLTASDPYFVVARDIGVFNDLVPDLVYSSGSFGNGGEILYLRDPANNLVDTANSNGGNWPAGSGSPTFASMERINTTDNDFGWATYSGTVPVAHDRGGNDIKGTPGQANWITTVTVTPSPTPTSTRTPTRTRTPTLIRTSTNTPGPPPPPPLVAINEFVPRPGHDWNNDGIINTGDEYIELINHGVVDVNLSGYRLDDEANIGSSVYTLPSIILKPGERIVFYGSQTNLLLSDGGDGVRLLRSNGQLVDAYNYFTVNFPDQSFCRLPDNGGLDDWNTNCYPTPGLSNSLSGSILGPPTRGGVDEPLCPIADTLPEVFVLAECSGFGNNIWNRYYWDKFGWFDEMSLPNVDGKWDIYAD